MRALQSAGARRRSAPRRPAVRRPRSRRRPGRTGYARPAAEALALRSHRSSRAARSGSWPLMLAARCRGASATSATGGSAATGGPAAGPAAAVLAPPPPDPLLDARGGLLALRVMGPQAEAARPRRRHGARRRGRLAPRPLAARGLRPVDQLTRPVSQRQVSLAVSGPLAAMRQLPFAVRPLTWPLRPAVGDRDAVGGGARERAGDVEATVAELAAAWWSGWWRRGLAPVVALRHAGDAERDPTPSGLDRRRLPL